MDDYQELIERLRYERDELDSIVMVMPYDYLDPPDGGNVPMSEQISRMWSEVKELRAELAALKTELREICAADYLHADSVLTDSALAKINEVLHD